MRVLLVNPSKKEVYGGLSAPRYVPLGIAYIGASLKSNGHSVRIIDMDADKIGKYKFIDIVSNPGYDLVGITVSTPSFNKSVLLAETVKKHSKAYTVLGGVHPTIMPKESLLPDSVDFVIKGEGEHSIIELLACIKQKKGLSSVDGLGYKIEKKIYINKDRPLIEHLDSLQFPARDLYENSNYDWLDTLYTPVAPMITSRGCPGQCTYCNTRNIFTRRFRARSAKNIVDEIQDLIYKFHVKEIHIWDDNFVTLKERVYDVRNEIKKRKINIKFAFPNGLRIDFLDEKILIALKDMGVYSIAIGVESGSQKILDSINKNTSIEQIKKKFRLIKKLGFEVGAFFMIGMPEETKQTILQTINLSLEMEPDIAMFHILTPFPGTPVYKELYQKGLITDFNFDHYGIHTRPVHRLPTLTENDLLYWQNEAYRKFYIRSSQILFQIRRITTWNRFKLNAKAGVSLLRKISIGSWK